LVCYRLFSLSKELITAKVADKFIACLD